MRVFLFLITILLFSSCRERAYIYELNEVEVQPNSAVKDKEKTQEQYINILYANMFQTTLSSNQLVDISEVLTSIGDKKIAYEAIVAKFVSDDNAVLPSDIEMREDVDVFIDQTYKRFYVRRPSEAERKWWKNYIELHPNVTPSLVYYAFASSNEYYHY